MRIWNLFLSAFAATGCASWASDAVEKAVPPAVEAGLASAAHPQNTRRIKEIMDEVPIKTSIVAIDSKVIDAVLASLAEERNEKHVRRIAKLIATTMSQEMTVPVAPALQQRRNEVVTHSAQLAVRAAVEELKTALPDLVSRVVSDAGVQGALTPLSRSAATGAIKGAADTLTGRDPDENR